MNVHMQDSKGIQGWYIGTPDWIERLVQSK